MARRLTATVRRAGLHRHPLLLLGLLLLGPALGFAWLGWRGVRHERALEAREAASQAREELERRIEALAEEVEALRAREAGRPYFAWQRSYVPEEMVFQSLAFQPSPLTKGAEDPRLLGWFQWERGAKGVFPSPDVFGAEGAGWVEGLVATYGPWLRSRLEAAEQTTGMGSARRVMHPLRVVAANEERGQLYEEIQIVQGEAVAEPGGAANKAVEVTPYLESFYERVNDDPVPVRYGPFRYLARPAGVPGPPLVAWRIVEVPLVHADRREVDRDRWLLQGFALDPGRTLPASWLTVGSTRLLRRDRAQAEGVPALAGRIASLVDRLRAEVLGPPGTRPDASMTLQALVDEASLAGAYEAARTRYLWLVLGLLFVVAVGFLVLTRGVRREVALARRKEDFVAAVTHELKTPLTGIRMYADMLREGWVQDEAGAERYATRIIEESDRLGHLVDQVLDLAALERGVARLDAEPGDLGEAVEHAARLVAARAREADVHLELEIEPTLPSVTFDPRLVRPLVLNLLDNAIKYSQRAEAARRVLVGLRREGDRVVLEVADEGVGIPAALRRHLFEPFQRAGNELTRTTAGVGIGLALVKRYADAHDARIQVDSEEGRGTTVRVAFPLD